MSQRQAMSFAIEAFRSPSRFRTLSRDQLPPGMLTVIKAAAGDESTLTERSVASGLESSEIQEAAKHYLFQVLREAGTKDMRLLALNPGAEPKDIKDHKRWLLKWLHPDRNPSTWEQALFVKISNFKESATSIGPAPLPMNRIVETSSSHPHVASRTPKKSRHRKWTSVERRAPSASPWRVLLRISKPLVASLFVATILVWSISSNSKAINTPLSWLNIFYRD